MTPTAPHGLTPAAYARWLSLTTDDQERVIDLVEDDREDEAAVLLGMEEVGRLRAALVAVTRATTLMEAVHVAESAAGGGTVGCATQDVVGCGIERTQV